MLRVLQRGYGNAPLNSDPVLHHVHPNHYTFRVHSPSEEFGGHLVRYDEKGQTVDPHAPPVDPAQAAYRIAFLGDSYVEATQVPYARSFVGRLQELAGPGACLRNYGVSSYSPLLYNVQWNQQVRDFSPTHVFLLMFFNDVMDDAALAGAAVRDKNGDVVAVPGPGGGRAAQQLRKLYVVRLIRRAYLKIRWRALHGDEQAIEDGARFGEENPDISALTSGLVLSLADKVNRSGAKFVLMAVPSRYRLAVPGMVFDEPEHSQKWRRWAQSHGVEFVDLLPLFRAAQESGAPPFLARDGHFNGTGHAVTAEAIRRVYPNVYGEEPAAGLPEAVIPVDQR